MSDNLNTTIEAPVVTAPVVAEVTPVVESTTVIEPAASEPVSEPTTFLSEPQKEEVKVEQPVTPAEPEATVDAKTNDEGGQSVDPAPPPVYDAFTLPEDVQVDNERMSKFTEILGELELKSKAEHAAVQEFGQRAVDLYISEVKQAVENVTKLYQATWEKQRNDWKDSFINDPELGGNRLNTTVDSARNFIRTHGGTVEQQAEFRQLMETSGLGNHPAMIRLLANAGHAMSEGKPLASVKPVSQPKSKTQTLYGKSN